ncbi:hypothetical protein EV363DRAFT_1164090, partial [Boletus edulis]
SDHRTFGKQHRSCKHPIDIPLVKWHCGRRTCHVKLVICVEEYSVRLGFLSSRSHYLVPIARVVPAYMFMFHSRFHVVEYKVAHLAPVSISPDLQNM